MKRVISESLLSEMKVKSSNSSGVLCYLEGACFQFDKVNRNNRIYSRKLVENKIINNPIVLENIKNRSLLGEGSHPENRVDVDYSKTALSCEGLWISESDDNTVHGRFAILDTPVGRILNTLANYGTKIGISARAVADSVQRDGHEVIVESSYELITFDAVTEPGFKCARLEQAQPSEMTTKDLKESVDVLRSLKNPVFESRIRSLDMEISKREDKGKLSKILESINSLSDSIERLAAKSNKAKQASKYESQLHTLMKEARDIISEARQKQTEVSNNINLARFNDENQLNESVDKTKIFNNNKDNNFLKSLCANYLRR